MGVGLMIAYMRRKRGLSQRALAEQVGVTRACVSAWERGCNGMTGDNLERLALALDHSLVYRVTANGVQMRFVANEELGKKSRPGH